MKVLFAISNEEVSESIVKKYQAEYKQIISSKNVYYFNAILKEIQKDKTYDRIVISEDLEAFTHSQYDQIDKFIFDKLDSISDEASSGRGEDIPIILICSDRRNKSEQILVKLFGIGIYNALLGSDRSVEEVCRLLNRPRTKKEAKDYYKIDSEEVNYAPESESDVSEVEIQNILAHYKKLGNNEEQFVESFDNIAEQYNDKQLRVISRVLPLNVRAVLEEKSPKYQKVMSFNNMISDDLRKHGKQEEVDGPTSKLLKPKVKKSVMSKPVVIPSEVNMNDVKKLAKVKRNVNIEQPTPQPGFYVPQKEEHKMETVTPISSIKPKPKPESQAEFYQTPKQVEPTQPKEPVRLEQPTQTYEPTQQIDEVESVNTVKPVVEPKQNENKEVVKKRGRGRPRKNPVAVEPTEPKVKRGRGRPRKNPVPEEVANPTQPVIQPLQNTQPIIQPLAEERQPLTVEQQNVLPGFEDDMDSVLPGIENNNYTKQEENVLPGFEDDMDSVLPGIEDNNYTKQEENVLPGFENELQPEQPEEVIQEETSSVLPGFEEVRQEEPRPVSPGYNSVRQGESSYTPPSYTAPEPVRQDSYEDEYEARKNKSRNEYVNTIDIASLLTPDKKIVSFLGTSKNGTSFIVNNLAELASSMGIKTAILDTTTNRNSYYIYTKNEESLREVARTSFDSLITRQPEGIKANKNLTVFTALPDEDEKIDMVDDILEGLVRNYSLILIDTDFNTPIGYFKQSQETYLVQSLDILTIQPLTAFLRKLKSKNILEESKIRIIINKAVKVRGIQEKTIIGGMAYYTDPAMSYMTELFDRNTVKYITIPFEDDTYIRYLENVINCEISLKGYSKVFMQSLKELANMVYPLTGGQAYRPPQSYGGNKKGEFTPSINSTLDQMKRNY